MKTRSNLKALTLASLSTLLLSAAGGALANPLPPVGASAPDVKQPAAASSCARAPRVSQAAPRAPSHPDDAALMAETMGRFAAIEQAVREGRISAYDGGRLMRWQWDVARFRQGFREGMQVTPEGLAAAPARGDGDACAEPIKDLANALAPLGGLAVNGMQAGMRNAAGLMRVLTREVGKLLAEEDVRAHGMSL